jgi:hypothetical protein
MKKLLFILFTIIVLSSCNCTLSQMPPQRIYSDASCTAKLPDYRQQITVIGSCTGYSKIQNPGVGTLVTSFNPQNVTITVTGTNGKSSKMTFTVTMLDTITPMMVITDSGLTYHTMHHEEIYYRKIASADSLHVTYEYDPIKNN